MEGAGGDWDQQIKNKKKNEFRFISHHLVVAVVAIVVEIIG